MVDSQLESMPRPKKTTLVWLLVVSMKVSCGFLCFLGPSVLSVRLGLELLVALHFPSVKVCFWYS